MDAINAISSERRRSDPALWVERLVIYESTEPLKQIREINFRRGINIIWAVEHEEAADSVGVLN